MRWLISWVGEHAGYINSSPKKAVENDEIGVGYMYLPVGQRQKGLHYHMITEIYMMSKRYLEGYDGSGISHRAGPMDLIYIPPGVPHSVRNCGSEDVELIWLHDGVEAQGVTVYCNTEEDVLNAGGKNPSGSSAFAIWNLAGQSREPRSLNSSSGPSPGSADQKASRISNRGFACESEKIAVCLTVLMPEQKSVPRYHAAAEVYVIVKGKA